jgi:hypothetical protein
MKQSCFPQVKHLIKKKNLSSWYTKQMIESYLNPNQEDGNAKSTHGHHNRVELPAKPTNYSFQPSAKPAPAPRRVGGAPSGGSSGPSGGGSGVAKITAKKAAPVVKASA